MNRLAILLAVLPLYAFGFQRVIDLPVDVSTTSEVVKDIEFYQGESVQLNLYVKRNGAKVALDSGLDVVWRAWVDGVPGSLYINSTGAVYSAASGQCRVSLTPEQANLTNQVYRYTVQLYDGATYMGVGASGELLVRYAPQTGLEMVTPVPIWPSELDDLSDVSAPSPSAGQVLGYDGTNWVAVAAGSGSGDITSVAAGTGLSGGGTSGAVTLNLANTAVSAGSYTLAGITVDAQGRITAASSGSETGDISAVSVSGGLLTGGGTTGAVSVGLTTNAVRDAVSGIYLPLAGGIVTGAAAFADSLDAAIITVSNITVDASGYIQKDGSEYWHPTNDGSSSGLDADLLDGQHGSYYLNWANITNKTGNLITDADKGDVTVSGSGGTFTIDAGAVTGSKAGAGVDRSTRINVKDYGATGDGSDQTTAIQSAFTAAAASTGKVFFPAGTYKLTSGVTLANVANADISGEGSTILIDIDTHGTYAVSVTNCTTLAVSGMKFDFNSNAYTNTAMRVRYIRNAARFNDCDFFGYGKEESTGIEFYRVGVATSTSAGMDSPGACVSGCNFYVNFDSTAAFNYSASPMRGTGLRFLEYAEYWQVQACKFTALNCGIYIYGGANGTVNGCAFDYIDGTFTTGSGFTAAAIVEYAGSAVNGGKHTITNNKFNHNWRASITLNHVADDRGSIISNNQFIANALDAIWISGASRFIISNNFFDRCHNFGSFTNHPTAAARQFILATNCASGLIHGNAFINSNGYCITSQGTSNNLVVMDNIYKTITTGFSSLAGAGNVSTDNHNK